MKTFPDEWIKYATFGSDTTIDLAEFTDGEQAFGWKMERTNWESKKASLKMFGKEMTWEEYVRSKYKAIFNSCIDGAVKRYGNHLVLSQYTEEFSKEDGIRIVTVRCRIKAGN